ncbi:MAG: methyltransferase type 12, partial [Marivirga sp.]|nr:methyltransferase type 12 [Marivirga sp.]
MNNQLCNVCGNFLEDKIYDAIASKSLTSLSVAASNPTEVYFCHNCEHLQTLEYGDESTYYDVSYNILTESEEEDQIYMIKNGEPIYRTEHQVSTLLSKVDMYDGIQILDYGCAKSSTMAKLLLIHENADIHLYDVSSNYLPFWDKFLDQSKWSTYSIPENWIGKFDLVTSFFSLEHISNLKDVISKIKTTLKKGATFYAVVPNFMTNIADLIVIDHPNHFTKSSISHLLSVNGFVVENIDAESHRGALVITAKLEMQGQVTTKEVGVYQKARDISQFWTDSSRRISEFEEENKSINA